MQKKHNQQGLTLIELLIGMTMSAMIFLVSSSLMASLFFSDTKSKHKEILEQAKNDIQSELSNQIRWGQTIAVTPNQLTIDGATYQITNERLYKNGDPLTPSDVVIDNFKVEDYSTLPYLASLRVEVELHHKTNTSAHDTLTLVASQRKLEFGEEK